MNEDWDSDKKFSKINPFENYHKKSNYRIFTGTPRRTFDLLQKIDFNSSRTL
jgi:hypothetical protein